MGTTAIKNDFTIDIATAHSRMSRKWKNETTTWAELVERCRETRRTAESVSEYAKMSKDEQSQVKDVGGFVGGYLSKGARKTVNVMWRSIATLDIDYGTPDFWDEFTAAFGFAAMLYSTHKHTPKKPRYRLVFPFSRQVRPDEYEPICRMIASKMGMELFDDTTYQLARLFYYPSTSRDGEYVFECQDGHACDVDEFLGMYRDYRDAASWPLSSRENDVIARSARVAGDPTEKQGLIGAFCRAYSIEEAIETFLPEVYEKTAHEHRYTYAKGSVAAGLVCYEGKFAYSNHETDPASRQLCNAFDLCRIHLFGVHDEGTKAADCTRLPSYMKMQELVARDGRVRTLLAEERLRQAGNDFACVDTKGSPQSDKWMSELDIDKTGAIKPTAGNIMAILENDAGLGGHLWQNLFSGFCCVDGGLPWDPSATQWGNTDDANLRVYLEEKYGVTGRDKIKDAQVVVSTRHGRHPIREYLDGLEWDGVPRLDTLVIDYLGAEDTRLNRAVTRKHFTAAVARVMEPGCKYDYCLILAGPEGTGKSTLFSMMGGDWFSDSLVTMEGTKGMEQLRDSWIIELSELGGIRKSDVEQVKAYLSRQNDMYRPAYGSVMESHKRQCVFCGTTNEAYFLKGSKGNRRFWVLGIDPALRRHGDLREALAADRDQLWAEAVARYREGEALYLDAELETEARKRQEAFNDNADDPVPDMIRAYLDRKLPPDWPVWDINRRRAYIKNPDPLDEEGTERRTKVCAAEILCEAMGLSMADKGYKYMARRVGEVMDSMADWDRMAHPSRHAEVLYGRQKSWQLSGNLVAD